MNTNTNTTNLNNSTLNTGNGGSDVGGIGTSNAINASTRLILEQQADLLAKIELILDNQARLELALRTSVLASNASLVSAARQEASSANV